MKLSNLALRRDVLAQSLAVAFGSFVVVTPALAQQAPTQALDRIEIVGSNIKRVNTEGPTPVTIITRQDIERSSASTVSELIQKLGVAGQSGFETQASASFVPGASAVGLRGLGAGDSLVLLNGRRLALHGGAQQSGSDGAVAFVDLNSLPLSAVEQIQILKDGASAIYGADAIAGVINVITRKSFRGVELGTRIGAYDQSGGQEVKASVVTGFGDLAKDRYNLLLTLEGAKQNPIWFRQREISANFDHRAQATFMGDQRSAFHDFGNYSINGGSYLAGSICPAEFVRSRVCRYNFGAIEQMQPSTERLAGLAVGTFQLTPTTTLFGEFALNTNKVKVEGRAPALDTGVDFLQVDARRGLALGTTSGLIGDYLQANANATVLGRAVTGPVQIRTRFTENGPRNDTVNVDTNRIVLGAKGVVGKYDWEAAYMNSTSKVAQINNNEINKELLADLILNGTVNLFAGNAKSGYNSARYIGTDSTSSKVNGFDAKFSGELASNLAFALGGELRKETIAGSADPISAAGLKVGSASTTTSGKRDLKSLFGELNATVGKGFEAQLAVRYDKYSDFGNTTNPKVAIRYQPNSSFLIRSSFGTAFKAPSLFQLYEAQAAGGYEDLIDSVRCDITGLSDDCDLRLIETRSGGARLNGIDLQPEKSKNFNLGFVIEPIAGTSVTLDLWNINKRDAITQNSAQGAIAIGSPSVIRNPTVGNLPGTIIRVIQSYQNSFSQELRGVDLGVTHQIKLQGSDRVRLALDVTYLSKFDEIRDPTADATKCAGNYNCTYAVPRVKGTFNVLWDRGAWSTSMTANYVHGYTFGFGPAAGATTVLEEAPSHLTLDGQVNYTGIKDLNIRVGIRNLLNRDAPLIPFFGAGTDGSNYDPRGRFIYVGATYKFK